MKDFGQQYIVSALILCQGELSDTVATDLADPAPPVNTASNQLSPEQAKRDPRDGPTPVGKPTGNQRYEYATVLRTSCRLVSG
jgi:hypothetical protein